MSGLAIFFTAAWIVFWVYWMASAANVKSGTRPRRAVLPRLVIIALVILSNVLLKGHRGQNLTVHNPTLHVVGVSLFVAGLGLAVWARLYLGRNWGMPMTRRDEPELVTTGPYQLVRHPIYSGILLAMLGTALAITLYWFIAVVVLGVYFVYSATVEEKIMAASFPGAYPSYRTKTKMLIPFVL